MKKFLYLSIALTMLIPVAFAQLFTLSKNRDHIYPTDTTQTEKEYKIKLLSDDTVRSIDLEEYVVGVVLAEMPLDFEMDALKAQAVVARTFACKRQKNPKHQNADVCNNSSCCQAYMAPEEYIKSGGTADSLKRALDAAQNTTGQVVVYENELIEATYFSCSGGQTESAAAVWGADVPYLQSVSSPGEEHSARFTESVTMSWERFSNCIDYKDGYTKHISVISYTDGGGVDKVEIGNQFYSGTELRGLLNLRSTVFEISVEDQTVRINTKGFGHRVGMSQYGADAMAVQGADYIAILKHYYKGVDVADLNEYGNAVYH